MTLTPSLQTDEKVATFAQVSLVNIGEKLLSRQHINNINH